MERLLTFYCHADLHDRCDTRRCGCPCHSWWNRLLRWLGEPIE